MACHTAQLRPSRYRRITSFKFAPSMQCYPFPKAIAIRAR